MTSREAIRLLKTKKGQPSTDYQLGEALQMAISALEKQGEDSEWCHDCKEYDKEQHCCHRFTRVIRQAVEEIQEDKA